MGSHHQFQDIQGLAASQQPADIFLSGRSEVVSLLRALGVRGVAWGSALPGCLSSRDGGAPFCCDPARFLPPSRTFARMGLSVRGVGDGYVAGARVRHPTCIRLALGTRAQRNTPSGSVPARKLCSYGHLRTAGVRCASVRREGAARATLGAATTEGQPETLTQRWPSSPGTASL